MAKGQPTARAGKKLGRYVIEKELGRGGMGVVYLARDENLGRRVALKTTSVAGLGSGAKTRDQRRQRFIREVQALAQMSHENVVHVYDAGEEDDPDLGWLLFLAMQYVEGITLAQLVQRRGPLDAGAAAAVCAQVSYGLGGGHARGIIHRDVKPANVFLSRDGRALIGDFGIAKIEGSTQITRRDQLVGTPNYLAPEQILGEPVTSATDVFALGALFYVIVINRPLRTKLDAASLLAGAKGNEAKEKMMAAQSVPMPLRKVVARALERDPTKRWRDGVHFGDALAELATRIPPLDDEPAEEAPPLAPALAASALLGEEDEAPAPGAGAEAMSAVELAAQALLSEVRQKKAPKSPAGPLMVARTESTVMFNLRAKEEDEGKKRSNDAEEEEEEGIFLEPLSPADLLPVARSESTVVFSLRTGEPRGQNQASANEPTPSVSEEQDHDDTLDPMSDDEAAGFEPAPGPPAPPAPPPRRPAPARPAPPPARAPLVREVVPPSRPRRSRPALDKRRFQLLGLSAGGGALAGVLVLLGFKLAFGASSVVLPKPVQDKPGEEPDLPEVVQLREHCGVKARGTASEAKALRLYDEAMALVEQGKQAGAKQLLLQALAANGALAQAHYELSQLHLSLEKDIRKAMRELECVVLLEGDSELGARAAKAIRQAGAAKGP
jgi:predicted Ser/Thr protein kinase